MPNITDESSSMVMTEDDPSEPLIAQAKPTPDILDHPLFHQLLGLIHEQNATMKEQRNFLEEQRDLTKEVKKAIENFGIQGRDATRGDTRENPDVHTDSIDTTPHQQPLLEPEAEGPTKETAKNLIHETLQQISTVLESVKDSLGSVKETLIAHGKKFDILTRDALKDNQPYEQKAMEDESTCTALFEMATAKTKEEVDDWIKRMDVSLVFIALFSAVLTVFLVPATQNLFPSNNNSPGNPTDSAPPVPKTSAQDVFLLYFLALILAIFHAVLAVLGRQWMSNLTNRPKGSTYRERLLRHLERETVAKRWLKYLVEFLHYILLASIGLFMIGLLYQLRNLAGSFDQEPQRLLIAWKVGLLISSLMPAAVAAATMHSLVFEVSPFGGPFSALLLKIFRTLAKPIGCLADWTGNCLVSFSCVALCECGVWSLVLVPFILITSGLWLVAFIFGRWTGWRKEFNTDDQKKLVGAFMDIMAESSQPDLLERAVGSFSYVEWFENGKGTADQLEKTWNRLTATDTSVRVRETLKARAQQFIPYGAKNWTKVGPGLTKELIQSFSAFQSWPEEFREQFLKTSFRGGNTDLRGFSLLPFEECIARVLCSYNHEGMLGSRWSIFDLAEKHCLDLFEEGKGDDVTRILSHVDRLDLIKSHIQSPDGVLLSLVRFIVRGRKHELLRRINEFVQTVDESRLGPRSLSQVFLVLASPPPTGIDLCPLIDYISRHPYNLTWKETSDTIIAYLTSFPLSQFSDSTPVRRFLKQCPDTEFRDQDGDRYPTSDENRSRAGDLLAGEVSSFLPLHSVDRLRRTEYHLFFHRRDRLYIHPISITVPLGASRSDSQHFLATRLSPLPFHRLHFRRSGESCR
ncbi:hypothetical protein SISSUDRAFT_1119885 [Sistotremastrum suecicum HHB10207 ss-3]|uniref:DUF6535 domain-containing protein n=1 Tax=Sistotremastrum suecicum HHB10207 ss-3 TaxID=1314776 RepID=A0A166D0A1_9AGAM|nr:hypothetical protein SISSUDRAFT_1119885 [Sistotremastrum suecicum HHB10207 ss-3]